MNNEPTLKYIYKYPVPSDDGIVYIELPEGAKILDVQVVNGAPYIYAIADPKSVKIKVPFIMYGTGQLLPNDLSLLGYIGTFQVEPYVRHLFQVLPKVTQQNVGKL